MAVIEVFDRLGPDGALFARVRRGRQWAVYFTIPPGWSEARRKRLLCRLIHEGAAPCPGRSCRRCRAAAGAFSKARFENRRGPAMP